MKSLKQKREAAVIKGTADIRSFWAKAPPASHSTSTTTTSSTGSASGSGTGANSGTTIPPKPKPPPSNTNIVKETTAHNIAHTASTSRASNAGGGPSRAPTAPSSNSSSNTINLSKPPLIQSNNNNHNQSRQSEIHPESSPLLPHFSKTPLVSKTYDAVDFPNSQLDATPTSSSSNNGECNIFWRKSPPLEKLKSFVKTVSKTDSEMEIRALSSSLGRVDDIPAKPVTSNDMISELWSQANHSSTSSFSISNSNTRPPHPFLLQSKSPHVPNTSSIATPSHSSASRSKTLKRSQSSSLISEGSPLIYERRAKRQHWASSSSSASNSMSSSLPNSGIKKLTSLLGTLQSLPPIQSRDDLDLSKTAMGTPFRKPFPRSKSSMDVREHERYQLENPPELLDLRQWSSLEKEAKARKENVGRENMGGAPYTANESPVKSYGNQNSHHSKIDSMMEDDDDEDDALFLAAAVELENGTNNNQSLNNTRSMEQSLESSESIVAPKKRAVDEFDDDVEFHPPAIKHEIRQVDEFDDDGGFSSFSDDSAIMDACAFAEREYQATQVAVVREVLESKENVTVSNHLALKSGAEPVVQKGLMDVDEFDDLDFDDGFLEAVDMEAMMKQVDAVEKIHQKQVTVVPVVKVEKRVKHQRFIVLEVQAENANIGGFTIQEKVLRLLDEAKNNEMVVRLREDWYYTDVEIGNYVHVVDAPMSAKDVVIDNTNYFIITNPDTLISATHVADSFECLRKSVFQDMCRVSNDANAAMVYGKLLHEIFQTCLMKRDFEESTIAAEVEAMIRRSLEELWSIGETESSARQHLMELVPNFRDWEQKYGRGRPTGPINVFRSQTRDKTTGCVSNVLDIEEHIWSPTWGIKGNIDASLEVKTQTERGPVVTHIMPFELKTGKSTTAVSHRAQASLYTLMMQDRYDVDVYGSLLYYLKTKELMKIPYIRDEIRGLLINRNKLASSIASRKLPEMIQNTRTCTHCYSLNTCLVYHKALEDGDKDSSGLGSLFDENTKDMTVNHAAFFKKWEGLLTKEEGDIQSLRKEVWTMGSTEREKVGSCLSGMMVVSDEDFTQDVSKVHRFTYTMMKADVENGVMKSANGGMETQRKSFLNLQLTAGDPIVISSEMGHYALAIGFLTRVEPDSVTVSVDRRLKGLPKRLDAFDMVKNQVYSSIRMNSEGVVAVEGVNALDLAGARYRIDKDELSAGMALVRGNLTNLFIPQGDAKRRRLVVDLEAPTFRPCSAEDSALIETDPTLNVDQKRAMYKVLTANDYSLILGMPGTGKTTTIAQIIKALVARGKSVLLTAYTHSAVDNVLLKLKSEGVDFVRLGGVQRVHPDLQEYTPKPFDSVSSVKEFYENKPVVATTCLGIKHAIFTKRKFDFCIVDEASQLTLPVCLGPLRFASVFVLVGDHYQLPPLVKNAEAREAGLAVSLFRLLSESHPESVVTLSHQYRMCEDIMHISNTLIYGSRLKCGSPTVANSILHIPMFKDGLMRLHSKNLTGYSQCSVNGICWIEQLLDPNRRVCFVDTDQVPGGESNGTGGSAGGNSGGSLVQNVVEAKLVGQLVQGLIRCGVDAGEIGIMSPYRAQLRLIGHELKGVTGVSTDDNGATQVNPTGEGAAEVEVLTIDKYQGRDKNCVLVSLVRSNTKKNVGDLLRDWRRLNVAFTRAKRKLIIFGSKSTLGGSLAFAEFMKMVDEKQWTLALPKDAHLFHESIVQSQDELKAQDSCKGSRKVNTNTEFVLKRCSVSNNILKSI